MEPNRPERSLLSRVPKNWWPTIGLTLLVLAFVFQNTNTDMVEFLMFEWEMSRIVLMLILLLIGTLIGIRIGVPIGGRLARRSQPRPPAG